MVKYNLNNQDSLRTPTHLDRLALRPKEAASALGISERTLFDLLKANQIKSFKINRAVLIPVDELKEFVLKSVEKKSGGSSSI